MSFVRPWAVAALFGVSCAMLLGQGQTGSIQVAGPQTRPFQVMIRDGSVLKSSGKPPDHLRADAFCTGGTVDFSLKEVPTGGRAPAVTLIGSEAPQCGIGILVEGSRAASDLEFDRSCEIRFSCEYLISTTNPVHLSIRTMGPARTNYHLIVGEASGSGEWDGPGGYFRTRTWVGRQPNCWYPVAATVRTGSEPMFGNFSLTSEVSSNAVLFIRNVVIQGSDL